MINSCFQIIKPRTNQFFFLVVWYRRTVSAKPHIETVLSTVVRKGTFHTVRLTFAVLPSYGWQNGPKIDFSILKS